MSELGAIQQEICAAAELAPYWAVNGLWIGLVKLANTRPTVGEEHEQVAALLRDFSRQQAAIVMSDEGVDQLLALTPPLETIFAHDRERLLALPAAKEMARLRERRSHDPKAALAALLEIVQRVRDKREHGFKTPAGPRDAEILQATASILRRFCEAAVANLAAGEGRAQFGS